MVCSSPFKSHRVTGGSIFLFHRHDPALGIGQLAPLHTGHGVVQLLSDRADADAFAPLAAAYGLPKDTPEQAAHKASVLEAALDGASAVPLQIMEKCAEGIALAGQYAAKGSVLAVSDAGCAAVLCKAALQAASLNVFINTKLMADRSRAAALDARADALLAEFVPRADETFTAVSGKLRNK